MKAAVLHELGQIPRCEPFSDPVAGEGELILEVLAAALKPVDKAIAAGSHYATPRKLPVVCGLDGVGRRQDGTRVFFAGPRVPFGAMAERTVVDQARCMPLPEGLDTLVAAALPNPGMSAWLSLTHRARLVPGETVLILGATGVAGQLAVQIAKLLGAARVVAAGRNAQVLGRLRELGADATISLEQSPAELAAAFARHAEDGGFQVVLDYVWGPPTEALLSALTRSGFFVVKSETRLVQIGETAGPTISLAASVLRSTALTILGTAGIPPRDVIEDAFRELMLRASKGEVSIEAEQIPLAETETAWKRHDLHGRRLVITP